MTAFPRLFTPATLRVKILRNRIVFGAHTANMAEDGLPGARHIGYYAERAIGGAAMIVVEPMPGRCCELRAAMAVIRTGPYGWACPVAG
jgi:2,4-dienoyl-CoA reductase-like NADH-dependent reductase (Old Yellow Enzyme family)